MDRWCRDYPVAVKGIEDSRGRPPQHTFFYPEEEYEAEYLDSLAALCRRGFGEVEVHLHHNDDTPDGLREKLDRFTRTLYEDHGLLRSDVAGRITYGFIHGNWALNNSHPQGRWCGVNDETSILRDTGCYADFTMPSAPDPCQTSTINSIYYALGDSHRPKSHDSGQPARVGQQRLLDRLLMVQGPLSLNWSSRKWGLVPKLENGDLTAANPASLLRLQRWCAANVHVAGREDWIFIKLHTHGAQEANSAMLLGEPMQRFHTELANYSKQCGSWKYWYVTARELAELIHEAENGASDPSFSPVENRFIRESKRGK